MDRHAKLAGWIGIAAGVAALTATVAIRNVEAHKPITSKYTYNEDVFPILRDRCGRCHFEGGPAPMSLLTYKDAFQWAESVREELVSERMPPWYAEDSTPVQPHGRSLTARELDVIVTWATGGTPEGDRSKAPPAFSGRRDWVLGKPDLEIPMEAEHQISSDIQEEVKEFALATGLAEERWIKATDVRPGNPTVVRDATISVENGPVLATWVAGDDPAPAPDGTAFRLPAGARLRMKVHYKKSWQQERQAISDRSTIGFYFASPPSRELTSLSIEPATGRDITKPMTIFSVRPQLDRSYLSFDVVARLPGGDRVKLLDLHAPRPEWSRRYWLTKPIDLPAGTHIEIVAIDAPPDIDPPSPKILAPQALELAIEGTASQ